MLRILVCVALLGCAGCMIPRSAAFGQTGALLSPGAFETSVTPGFAWRSETNSQTAPGAVGTSPVSSSSTSTGLSLPVFEGNVAYGLSAPATLNLHLSPAGLQPGVKVRLVEGPLSLAILPEIGVGVFSAGSSSSYTVNGVTTTSSSAEPQSLVNLQAGFKFLGRHDSGLYGGLGYTFQSTGISAGGAVVTGTSGNGSRYNYASHHVQAAVGFEWAHGPVRLRPELALMFSPAVTYSTTSTSGSTSTTTQANGTGFMLFPNITMAIASPGEAAAP
ncbi:MAG: hypothetical protein ACYC8T_37870 [Myxococcaceae bacterium]